MKRTAWNWLARGGIALIGLSVALEAASTRLVLGWTGRSGRTVAIWHGQIGFGRDCAPLGSGFLAEVRDAAGVGFQWWFWDYRHAMYEMYYVPLWLPGAALVLPTGWCCLRARRSSLQGCRACGYDLVGLPGPVCPECGECEA